MRILAGRKYPSDYKYHRLTTPALFSPNLRRLHCPASLYPFSSFSFCSHIICRHNGLLRSFRSRGACLFDTCCWPDHTCTCVDNRGYCPDIPCNSTHRYSLRIQSTGEIVLVNSSAFLTSISTIFSRIRLSPRHMFAGHRLATISATRVPRTRTRCARRCSSITFLVLSFETFLLNTTEYGFRFLLLCSPYTRLLYRRHRGGGSYLLYNSRTWFPRNTSGYYHWLAMAEQ